MLPYTGGGCARICWADGGDVAVLANHMKDNPIDYTADALQVEAWMCLDCGTEHVQTRTTGPGGRDCQDFHTVPDALNYLLNLAAALASNGRPHAWEFAHYLTTWVTVAVDGTPTMPRTPQRMH